MAPVGAARRERSFTTGQRSQLADPGGSGRPKCCAWHPQLLGGIKVARPRRPLLFGCYQGRRRSSCPLRGVPQGCPKGTRRRSRLLLRQSIEGQSCYRVPSFCDFRPTVRVGSVRSRSMTQNWPLVRCSQRRWRGLARSQNARVNSPDSANGIGCSFSFLDPARSRRIAIASAVYRPCFKAFLFPFGAPGDGPPCIRQRPFFIAGDRQAFPLLVFAHSAGWIACPRAWGWPSLRCEVQHFLSLPNCRT